MTQQGFEHYIFSTFGITTGTANSYITAIHIIDEMFEYDDVFALKGKSVTSIDNFALLYIIYSFVREKQRLFQNNNDSIFRNINTRQKSYPRGGFCSAAMQQLMLYFEYEKRKQADLLLSKLRNGTK
ncbi:MAG: hypothetical protein Q4F34_08145, partial [Prevotellaceae bacterium]|nr:hypothetical protein [Prevotellaceae bacterium]